MLEYGCLCGPKEEALLPGNEPVLSLGILPAVGAGNLEPNPPGLGMPEPTGRAILEIVCVFWATFLWTDEP